MKFAPNLILTILFLIIVFQTAIITGSDSVSVNFEVKDTNGNPLKDSLVIIQRTFPNSDFSENKLTDSGGKTSFTLNQNEVFVYIVYKLSYEEKIGGFNTFTSEDKNIPITLEKIPGDQWFFYLINNGELEFRFKGLDEDTNYEPDDYIKSVLEIKNVAGKNIKLIKDKSVFQFADSQTLNVLRAWGNFDISGGSNLEGITLKKNGQMKVTFSEGVVEICGSNLIVIYMGQTIELSGEEFLCVEQNQQYNRIPEWILKNKYKFKIDFFYEIDEIEKSINFVSQEFFIDNVVWAPEIISFPETDLLAGEEWTYEIQLKEYDESFSNLLDMINYRLIKGPDGMTVDEDEGIVRWTPIWGGDYNVIVRAYHEYFENDSEKIAYADQEFTLNVEGAENNPPVITSAPITEVDENEAYSYQVIATDEDEDILTYSLIQAPSWLSIDAVTGLITGAAPEVDANTDYEVTAKVSDGTDIDTQTYTLSVINIPFVNNPPVAQNQNVITNQDIQVNIQLVATDADEDVLTYSIVSNPANGILSSFNSATGQITYTPDSGFSGSDSFTFKANDGKEDSNLATVSITVNTIIPNNPPVITSTPITEINENTFYSYQITATDADNDTLIYFLTQAPSWLSINSSTGLVSGTAPNVNSDTNFDIIIEVLDGEATDSQSYVLTVKKINNAPIIISTAVTSIDEGQDYIYQVTATDADGDILTYSLTQTLGWLSIDAGTGLISGTAPEVDANTDYEVTIEVSDGTDIDTQTYTLTVINIPPVNNPPVITSIPITSVNEESTYTYDIEATDIDGDSLIYSLTQAPDWLSINSSTGLISGMAPEIDEDTEFNITVGVSDMKGGNATQNYILVVKEIPTLKPKTKNHGIRVLPVDEFYEQKYLEQFNPKVILKEDTFVGAPASISLKSKLEEIYQKPGMPTALVLVMLNLNLMMFIIITTIKKLSANLLIKKI
jgi:hypothetical protein